MKNIIRDILVILTVATTIYLRSFTGGIIRPLDSEFPLYPSDLLSEHSYTWFEKGWIFGNDGSFTSRAQMPFLVLPAVVETLGFTLEAVNHVTLIILSFATGLSGYVMSRKLLQPAHSSSSLVAGLFYMCNPYMIGELNLGHWFTFYAYASIPMMLLAFIKGLEGDRWVLWAMVFAVLSIFVVHRVRLVPVLAGILAIYFVFHLVSHRNLRSINRTLAFLGTLLVGIGITNAYWLFPFVSSYASVFDLLIRPVTSSSGFLNSPTFDNPLNILRLVGYGIPTWHATGKFYIEGIGAYTTIALFLVSFGVFFLRRKDRLVKFFGVSALVFTSFILSISGFQVVMNRYLLFQELAPSPLDLVLFPNSFEFLLVPAVVAYSYLLGVGVEEVRKWLKSKFTDLCQIHLTTKRTMREKLRGTKTKTALIVAPIFMIALVLTNSLPLVLGVSNDFLAPVSVPAYYEEARRWLVDQPQDYVILAVPRPQNLQYVRYEWAFGGKYEITDILPQVSPVPVIGASLPVGAREGVSVVDIIYESLGEPAVASLLSLIGAKYIVHRRDVPTTEMFDPPPGFWLEQSIGKLDFFRNPYYAPIVSGSNRIISVWGNERALLPLSYVDDLARNSTVFVFYDEVNREFIANQASLLVDYNEPIEDSALLNRVYSGNLSVAYILDSGSFEVPVLSDEEYGLINVYWNGTTLETIRQLRKSSLISLERDTMPLASDSIFVSGVSVPTDRIDPAMGSYERGEINWQADKGVLGFHALYLNINRSTWDLENLHIKGGSLALEIYGDGTGREIRFSFMAPRENYFHWPLQSLYLDWTGWRRLSLPLARFSDVGSPNWQDVVALWIWQDMSSDSLESVLKIRAFEEEISARYSIFWPASVVFHEEEGVAISVAKISPVKYRIHVNSETPLMIRFNTAYAEGWQASRAGSTLQHLRLNSYSNGYFVPTQNIDVDVEISYGEQDLSYLGAFISISFMVSIVFLPLWNRLPRRRNHPAKS